MNETSTLRDKFLSEFSLSKSWVITNLLYAISNKIERVPIFIKSSKDPCRDTFWDATITYNDGEVKLTMWYRDMRLYEKINLDGVDDKIKTNLDINVLQNNVAGYVERLAKVCFEKHSIKIID